jgi:hypothetical protein
MDPESKALGPESRNPTQKPEGRVTHKCADRSARFGSKTAGDAVSEFFFNRTCILFQVHGMTVCFIKWAIAGKNSPP